MWMSKVGSRCSDGIEAGCLECWDCGAWHQVLIKRQEAEKCADLWARTEQETRFTEKSKNRLRHRTDFLGQTSVSHGKECYGAVCRSFSHPHPAVQTRSLLTSFLHRQVQGFSATHISVHPESCIVSTYWSWNILCLSFVLETQVLDSLSERTKILPQT